MRPRRLTSSVCAHCIGGKRPFSTPSQQSPPLKQDELPASPPKAGFSRLTNRGLISITGIDSTTFLQGLVTQNMLVANDPNRSARRTGCYTAFLNSQGRILNDAFLYPLPEAGAVEGQGWLVEVDKNEVTSLMKHLKKHKLRAKLKLRALDDGERTVWSSWKDYTEPRWAAYNLESETASPFSPHSLIAGCLDTRAPGFGSRIVTPGPDDLRAHFPDETHVAGSEVSLGSYTVRRMFHGVAEGQSEIIRESALPLECNVDMMRGVDFRKGCYVGQELTIRTHHTGVVRKRILPVQLYGTDQMITTSEDILSYDPTTDLALPPSGSNISKVSTRRGRSAGKFLGGVGNIGLALCRLEMMTDIVLTSEGSQYTPGQEFKITWEGDDAASQKPREVKVKAYVPQWLREHILYGGVRKGPSRTSDVEGQRARDMVEQLGEEEIAQRRLE